MGLREKCDLPVLKFSASRCVCMWMCVRELCINYGVSNRTTVALSLAVHMLLTHAWFTTIWGRDFRRFCSSEVLVLLHHKQTNSVHTRVRATTIILHWYINGTYYYLRLLPLCCYRRKFLICYFEQPNCSTLWFIWFYFQNTHCGTLIKINRWISWLHFDCLLFSHSFFSRSFSHFSLALFSLLLALFFW